MSVYSGASPLHGGMAGTSFGHTHGANGLASWEGSSQPQTETWDAVETYFECITTCSLEDGECITRCVEQLRET